MTTNQLPTKFSILKYKLIRKYLYDGYFDAIKTHNHGKFKRIIRWFPHVMKAKNPLGLTGLMQAVASRNYEAITLLLQKGIDPNIMDQDGWTAKAWAILMNDIESLKRLRGPSAITHSSENDVCAMAMVGIGTMLSDKTLSI